MPCAALHTSVLWSNITDFGVTNSGFSTVKATGYVTAEVHFPSLISGFLPSDSLPVSLSALNVLDGLGPYTSYPLIYTVLHSINTCEGK